MKKNITTLLGILMLLVPCTVMAQDTVQLIQRTLPSGTTVTRRLLRPVNKPTTRGMFLSVPFVAKVPGTTYGEYLSGITGKVNMTFYSISGDDGLYGNSHTDGTIQCGNGNEASIADCGNKNGVYSAIVPDTIWYKAYDDTYYKFKITELADRAFYECDIQSLKLPIILEKIGDYALDGTWVDSLTIPQSVSYISERALSMNEHLRYLVVEDGNPNYVTEDNVLFNKEKTKILYAANNRDTQHYVIPNTVTTINDYAFNWDFNLQSVTIPNSVREIGEWGFQQCHNLGDVFIPSSVVKLGSGAFTGPSKITKITVENGNPVYHSVNGVVYTNVGDTLMMYPVGNPAHYFEIPNGTKTLFDESFSGANHLKTLNIPNSVTSIGRTAFFACDSLESIDIPSSVTYIGSQAFDYCYKLTKVNLHSLEPPTTPTWSSAIFGGNKNLQIYVPYQSVAKYEANKLFTVAHIDPAIDRHDNHWTWVATFIHGVDFTNMQGAKAYKLVKNDDATSGAKVNGAPIALAANGNASPLKLVQVDKAGAGDCVLIKFDEDAPETIELTTDTTAENITDNLLKGVTDTTTVGGKEGTGTNYVFDGENFVQVTGTTDVATGLGYLQLPEDIQQSISGSTITIADLPTTGIDGIHADSEDGNQAVYNLQGQRVNNPTHGVYIVNGRKVVIK